MIYLISFGFKRRMETYDSINCACILRHIHVIKQPHTHTAHIHAQMLILFTSKTLNSFCICTMINTKEIATDASNAIQMESKTNEIACNLPDTRPAHFFFIIKFIRTNCGEHKLKSCMKYIVPLPQKIMSKQRYKTALVYDFDMN